MQQNFQNQIKDMLATNPVLPVIAIPDAADAVPLAQALMAGGITNIEVTLRTDSALECINAIAGVEGMTVGAGTVFTPEHVRQVKAAGASYIVSPGFSEAVFQECLAQDIPYLPGAVTPTEIQALQEKGFRFLKFFPAEASGGVGMLKALAPVFKEMKFCATGGITIENMGMYQALPNICAVGMSAMVPADVFTSKDWSVVTEMAKKITAG